MALFLVLFPATQILDSPTAVGAAYPSWQVLTTFLDILGYVSLLLFFYLFPDGRFVPRWTRSVAFGSVVLNILGGLISSWPFSSMISFFLGLPLLTVGAGIGLPAGYHAGVGLLSMRERSAELGGTCEISQARGGGTCVRACLPLSKE